MNGNAPDYIAKLKSIPKEKFLFGPSPIQYLPRLSQELSPEGGVKIWAKRDDCNSGLAYGGNKVRKLEYLVADAKKQGCDTLVSVGGVQSNHTRAVTAVATASGLKAVTVQEKWVPIDPPLYDKTGNILLSRLMGGDVRLNQEGFHIGHKEATKEAVESVKAKGGKPYYVPAGASDHELGGLGFTNFVVELAEQEAQMGLFFDTLIVCSVTGSSHAGLLTGAVAEGKGRKVIGIDASGKPAETKFQITRIARNTAKLLDPSLEILDEAIILDERFHEGIYGIPGPSTIEAMKMAAQTDALITDPVYEGKSMAGMMQLIKEGSIKPGSNVLYVHLGGQPALNAYSSYFE
ncbi:putative 1-aminocyclopropane-1-carboxylate [Hortaea werneckii]|uniref:Tryptophan synthase beta chain-like PALP domain-containing protein n=2 Tax=Hortaea werneckii TaxID=91943 RepID=A0A3M7I6B0_HORWE|nr:putative 1-aminocyclopropane-1-carboxylate [Hortaea werneckii]OTA37720.1 putative 1-aminocyclopropane-1-carboxylate deaminase [Hortaea werneckii EXF-2000]KAI6803917.1 putative 1-aminocyclopropane-1-carboxylate [Hortaea werneckii]KAI6902940.1 putative 1-aminocyclopropane-1-carboxylate [Hortaea werneckii]KAI6921862.1 putative 1-aminocyclopropane-1-carboxylate [Hortaea werneckii]